MTDIEILVADGQSDDCDSGCTVDADCDDGLFCNGAEICNVGTGVCEAGTPPACDNGLFCDGAESCNESTDSCDAGTPPVCDDGAFCNGTESCDEGADSCTAGTPPESDDGVGCTDDSCDEVNDVIVHTPNDGLCDNGAFCDGSETCDAELDCQGGTAPCNPETETCDETDDVCEPIGCTVDADCDDGTFCNGAEICNAGTGIGEAGAPVVCDNGLFCDGAETCNEGTDSCDAGTPVVCDDGLFCNGTDTCNEGTDSCDAGTPPVCDNGQFCDGTETCNEGTDSCDAGTPACADGETCDEGADICVPSVCDGDGICEEGENCTTCPSDCISGTLPGASCGNGICEAGDGENAVLCPADCNGILNGKKPGRFSCGFNDGYGPDGCGDPRCNSGGFTCTEVPAPPAGDICCGDDICEVDEDTSTCGLDCGDPPVCGNGIIELGEICDGDALGGETCDSLGYDGGTLVCQSNCLDFNTDGCNLPACVPTHSNEKGPRCSDGLDNDCDGLIDGADPDC